MDTQQYLLRYSKGDNVWEQEPLEYGDYIIGRGNDCDITLYDDLVSRVHARLEIGPEGCWIMDMGSSNGTMLEGKKLPANRKKPLGTKTVFTIAGYQLMVLTLAEGEEFKKLQFEPDEEQKTPQFQAMATRVHLSEEETAEVKEAKETAPDAETRKHITKQEDKKEAEPPPPDTPPDEQKAVQFSTSSHFNIKSSGIRLRMRKPDDNWEYRDLTPGVYILGRIKDSDIQLLDPSISRKHARLEIYEDSCAITDLDSANGIHVEGKQISSGELYSLPFDQVFVIGSFQLAVEASKTIDARELEGAATRIDAPVVQETPSAPKPEPEPEATRIDRTPSNIILHFRKANETWTDLPLDYGEYTFGRTQDCDIKLIDPNVSRRHARLEITPEGCYIMDLGSVNGTQIKNNPLFPRKKTMLEMGEIITIAIFQLKLTVAGQEDTAATAIEAPVQEAETDVLVAPAIILRYRQGDSEWKECSLTEGDNFIGREADCNVAPDSKLISRKHAVIHIQQSSILIEDLGSTNGVKYKGQKILSRHKVPLQLWDTFQIEDITFELVSPGVVPETQVSPIMGQQLPQSESGQTMVVEAAALVGIEEIHSPLNLLGHERVAIGRAPDNQIVFNHPLVSRYHAVIERMGKRTRLLDLHSANGVFVNGQPVDENIWLQEGDQIKIGPYNLDFTGNELVPMAVESYTVEATGLNKWVTKSLNLLKDISLSIGQNEFVALVGMSGAGKSTLMDAINGFRPATNGTVLVNGVDLYQNYGMFRDDIGNVPQKDIVHMELTAQQALDYAAQLRMPADTSKQERQAAINETLEDLGLTFRKDIPIHRLSGGQLKRVSIGVELLTKPRLFFLDEPTSGLDPGTEYEMMKLLRRLADQGRTIMIITHATKNVMFCDKAIILAKGGNVAFYGPPEHALEYFDRFRTNRERLEKDMEFDDIYRILQDESRGKPEEWRERYLQSEYARYIQPQGGAISKSQVIATGAGRQQRGRRISSLKQLMILSARNLKIMFQDKVTLGLTLMIAPVLGIMNFIWGSKLFDPVMGDSAKVMAMWFINAIIALLVGSMGSVREIVKENDIYKRERAVGLKILPYIISKAWLGGALSVYQGAAILIALLLMVRPFTSSMLGYPLLLVTMILAVFCGYLLGLLVSALAPNQNSAQIILIAALVPQFLFAGVLYPLNKIFGGEIISPIVSSRWTFEAFVNATGMGEPLANDPCWNLPKDVRTSLDDEYKIEKCSCMGPQLFRNCVLLPGIMSPDIYSDAARVAMGEPEPAKPFTPTTIPSPTENATPTLMATPTYLPTPTLLNTPTYLPTPTSPNTPTAYPVNIHYDAEYVMGGTEVPGNQYDAGVDQRAHAEGQRIANAYQKTREAQMYSYQETREAQFEVYRDDSEGQIEIYRATLEMQADDYRAGMEDQMQVYRSTVEVQVDAAVNAQRTSVSVYANQASTQVAEFIEVDLEDYAQRKEAWETTRQKAIASAEAILGVLYDDYGRAFQGSILNRWLYILLICLGEFIGILILQKRKDVI